MLTLKRIVHAIVCMSVFWIIHGNPFESVLGVFVSAVIGAIVIVGCYHFTVKERSMCLVNAEQKLRS